MRRRSEMRSGPPMCRGSRRSILKRIRFGKPRRMGSTCLRRWRRSDAAHHVLIHNTVRCREKSNPDSKSLSNQGLSAVGLLSYPESYPSRSRAAMGPLGIGWARMSRHGDHPLPASLAHWAVRRTVLLFDTPTRGLNRHHIWTKRNGPVMASAPARESEARHPTFWGVQIGLRGLLVNDTSHCRPING